VNLSYEYTSVAYLQYYGNINTHEIGGTQSLHTNAYDEAVGLPTTETARVARNTQLILQEEASMCLVADPWAGSYFMESLTEEIYLKAVEIINQVESMGGMTSYILSGDAKRRIEVG